MGADLLANAMQRLDNGQFSDEKYIEALVS